MRAQECLAAKFFALYCTLLRMHEHKVQAWNLVKVGARVKLTVKHLNTISSKIRIPLFSFTLTVEQLDKFIYPTA